MGSVEVSNTEYEAILFKGSSVGDATDVFWTVLSVGVRGYDGYFLMSMSFSNIPISGFERFSFSFVFGVG